MYYTYTVAPTNNQVVINSVCFMVRANQNGGINWNDKAAEDTSWYRSEVAVNWHLTFTE